MTGIKGELRVIRSKASPFSNSPGVVRLADDEFMMLWMDPDGVIADRFDDDPRAAQALFLAEKQKGHTRRSTRRK